MRAAAAACEVVAEARELPPELSRPIVLLAVCRSYLECGDVNRAVDVGEAALAEARDDPTFSSDEAGELRATVALCYLERGDLTRASVILDEALRLANAAGSLPARAAALWNKAFVAEANGDARGAELLAESALAAYGETERAVATAILRADLAGLSLRVGNTDYERIERDLVDALGRLRELNAPKMVVAQAAADLARCKLAQGEPVAALTIARDALRECGTEAVIELANLRAVLAEASLELHGDDEAVAGCYRVAEELRRMGRPRRVKAALVSLAEALYRTGRAEDAIVLFRLAVRPYAPDDDAPDRATPYDGAGVTRATAPLDDADARLHR
jgi:tetratricopeptide (TPR) repeat protein